MKVTLGLIVAVTTVMAQTTYTATGVGCEPHDDHWHCPTGVAEPTTPPAPEATGDSDDHSHSQSIDTVSATASGVCEPHDDHWHCPAGVPEPTSPPAAGVSTGTQSIISSLLASSHSDDNDYDHDHAVTASTCEPHGDHWHCPSGVAEPTTTPAVSSRSSAVVSTTRPASTGAATNASSASVAQATGASIAIKVTKEGVMAALLGAVAYLW